MKIISFSSSKDGAGRTTALMAVCSNLVKLGYSVAVFDTDPELPLVKWQQIGELNGMWSQKCEVFAARNLQSLIRMHSKAQNFGFAFGLIDLNGNDRELYNRAIHNSHLTIVPTSLSRECIENALQTYKYVVELQMRFELDNPLIILRQKISIIESEIRLLSMENMIKDLPLLNEIMHSRAAYSMMPEIGMLLHSSPQLQEEFTADLTEFGCLNAARETRNLTKTTLNIINVL